MNYISDALLVLIYIVGFLVLCIVVDSLHTLAYNHIPAYAGLWDKLCNNLSNGL